MTNDPGSTMDGNQDVYITPDNHPGELIAGGNAPMMGFSFSADFTSLTQITSLILTLTMIDGDSATAAQEGSSMDDFDYNHFVLYLGGTYDAATGILMGGVEVFLADGTTPLYLNGFRGGSPLDTETFTNISISAATSNAILAQLAANNGFLPAFVGTDNTGDSSAGAGETAPIAATTFDFTGK